MHQDRGWRKDKVTRGKRKPGKQEDAWEERDRRGREAAGAVLELVGNVVVLWSDAVLIEKILLDPISVAREAVVGPGAHKLDETL